MAAATAAAAVALLASGAFPLRPWQLAAPAYCGLTLIYPCCDRKVSKYAKAQSRSFSPVSVYPCCDRKVSKYAKAQSRSFSPVSVFERNLNRRSNLQNQMLPILTPELKSALRYSRRAYKHHVLAIGPPQCLLHKRKRGDAHKTRVLSMPNQKGGVKEDVSSIGVGLLKTQGVEQCPILFTQTSFITMSNKGRLPASGLGAKRPPYSVQHQENYMWNMIMSLELAGPELEAAFPDQVQALYVGIPRAVSASCARTCGSGRCAPLSDREIRNRNALQIATPQWPHPLRGCWRVEKTFV